MKGKLVNLLLGLLNILVGISLLIYTLNIPTDITLLTVQEREVVEIIKIVIYVIMGISVFINFLAYINNKSNYGLSLGYRVYFFILFFILIKQPLIAAFPIFSGILVVQNILRQRIRELESVFAISIILVVAFVTFGIDASAYFYKNIGSYVLDKKNASQTEYSESFFKYITELEGYDRYINVKKNGKFGYINTKGEEVIGFKYDFATPFTTIRVYNKDFQVALVGQDGISKIIMKNERVVMSYVSESQDDDYEAKIEELTKFYKDIIGMKGEMPFEIEINDSKNLNYAPVYEGDVSEEYTYRYDYNDDYDIIVTQSSMGRKDSYALVRKDNEGYNLPLTCDNLDYDENRLYLYTDGSIPFYDIDKNEQGWFSSRGVKEVLNGNAQILDKFGDIFLYKDYSKDGKITFYLKKVEKTEKLSDSYKEIFIQDGRYVVKKANDKYTLLNDKYEPIFEQEYDYADISLANEGIYLFGNVDDVIEFNDYDYADLKFTMLDSNGNVLNNNLEQVYTKYYKMSEDNKKAYVTRYNEFVDSVKSLNERFVGDKFYKK